MLHTLKRRALEYGFERYYAWRIPEFYANQLIEVDYPVDPTPRHAVGSVAHQGLWRWFDRSRDRCADTLHAIATVRDRLECIPAETADPRAPHWNQHWFSALDGMALYALVATRRPARIVEVGSGNSTKFAAQAIRDAGLSTTLTSIDPHPRADIDALCQHVIREPLERADQRVFATLAKGDVLFIDSSHRTFTNSDVTTLFLEVLPMLPAGVLVHIHDVFLPWDYPAQWGTRYYSEQYLLAAWLLAGPERLRLVLSNVFVSCDANLRSLATEALSDSPLAHMMRPEFRYGQLRGISGTSFWAETA